MENVKLTWLARSAARSVGVLAIALYGLACTELKSGNDILTTPILPASACTGGAGAAMCGAIDGCCPSDCGSLRDRDCSTRCGDGVVDTAFGETCDPAGTPPCPVACANTDNDPCTADRLVRGGTCSAVCDRSRIVTVMSGDGCCPAGATAGTDSDCASTPPPVAIPVPTTPNTPPSTPMSTPTPMPTPMPDPSVDLPTEEQCYAFLNDISLETDEDCDMCICGECMAVALECLSPNRSLLLDDTDDGCRRAFRCERCESGSGDCSDDSDDECESFRELAAGDSSVEQCSVASECTLFRADQYTACTAMHCAAECER
jgi:hypothetical protein